jgi:hypothetical protein
MHWIETTTGMSSHDSFAIVGNICDFDVYYFVLVIRCADSQFTKKLFGSSHKVIIQPNQVKERTDKRIVDGLVVDRKKKSNQKTQSQGYIEAIKDIFKDCYGMFAGRFYSRCSCTISYEVIESVLCINANAD